MDFCEFLSDMDMKSVQKQSGVLLKGGGAVVPAPPEGFNRMKLEK